MNSNGDVCVDDNEHAQCDDNGNNNDGENNNDGSDNGSDTADNGSDGTDNGSDTAGSGSDTADDNALPDEAAVADKNLPIQLGCGSDSGGDQMVKRKAITKRVLIALALTAFARSAPAAPACVRR